MIGDLRDHESWKKLLSDQQHDNAEILRSMIDQSCLSSDLHKDLVRKCHAVEALIEQAKASQASLESRMSTLDEQVSGILNVACIPVLTEYSRRILPWKSSYPDSHAVCSLKGGVCVVSGDGLDKVWCARKSLR
jgi:hypothetical protein